jgi:hypothetical protein
MRIAAKVELSKAQRRQLEMWATGRTIPVRLAERAKMMLLAAQGQTDKEIGAELGIWRGTVARWRARFIADGVTGIEGGFNRSMQHTRDCASRRSVADEAKTSDLLHGKPEGANVGALAEGRISSADRPAV